MSNLVKYGTWTPEARKAEAEEVAKAGGGDFLKLVEGRNVLRFLPPRAGQTSPFLLVWQHYVKKPGQSTNTSITCPRAMAKRHCPVCDYADELRRTGVTADRELAYQMSAKLRIFANVVDRAAPDKGPQVLGLGKKVHEQLLALADDDQAGGDFTNPETGYDVIIERQGTGKDDTTYMVRPARHNSPLGNMDWIDAQPDNARLAQVRDEDEINEMLGIGRDPNAGARTGIGPGAGAGPAAGSTVNTTARTAAQSAPRRTAQDIADEDEAQIRQ